MRFFGWAPGWDAWLGLGFLREDRVALLRVYAMRAYLRPLGFREDLLWGLVFQRGRLLPLGARLP